jgi:ATP-dependent DNA helicase RecG
MGAQSRIIVAARLRVPAKRAPHSSSALKKNASQSVVSSRRGEAVPGPLTPAVRQRIEKLGIRRDLDLILHLPLRYEDETQLTPIAQVHSGEALQVEGAVRSCDVMYRPRRQLVCRIQDETGEMALRFFNFYPSQAKALFPGARVRAFGEARTGFFGAEMVHPRFRVLHEDSPLPDSLTPIYPTTAGLSQSALRGLVQQALQRAELDDTLPESVLRAHHLWGFREALDVLHNPRQEVDADELIERTHPAWRRVKFDELLAQQLSMRQHYRTRRAKSAAALESGGQHIAAFLERLPFRLTPAQGRAWVEIERDLAVSHPMHRLLQGDVGSGKTVVAVLAALRAVENQQQAAVMAPTEILAEQHYRKFSDWLTPLGIGVEWLSGGQTKKEREAALERIATGRSAVAVGTHALFQDKVQFLTLALAIVDEQHRFGVAQRLALRSKGVEPHQLMMSATPIPRTLAMSFYADLDVSVIDELPPGRTPIRTKLLASSRRHEIVQRVEEACRGGRQVYWVCPLIEESEQLQLQTALDTHAALSEELPELNVGLLHGRMKPLEKSDTMALFQQGKIDLLVATTVVEVGVDVPNASLMVIEHAERFGLSQLHQLRGRVGRGAAESVCVLLYHTPLGETARKRLRIIYENTDGFAIAREDLNLRGPGEVLGSRQSGVPLLRFADIEGDRDLLELAREVAELLLDAHPDAARRHLDRWLGGRADFLKA